MLKPVKHRSVELSTSSVADIAFLLLSFFLMTTVIEADTGLSIVLPEWRDQPVQVPSHERNIFKIRINSNNAVMIEGEVSGLDGLKARIKEFVLNPGKRGNLAENPVKAVVLLESDRGTSHKMFMAALDEIQGAYYEMYASRLGIAVEEYRKLRPEVPADRALMTEARKNLPMNISIGN